MKFKIGDKVAVKVSERIHGRYWGFEGEISQIIPDYFYQGPRSKNVVACRVEFSGEIFEKTREKATNRLDICSSLLLPEEFLIAI